MPVTPRRSTRGAIFTPSPHPTQAVAQANTTYHWLSAPSANPNSTGESSSSALRTRYNSFRRIVGSGGTGQLGQKGRKRKVAKGEEESRFTVGDGVLVGVDGGDGVGVLIGLWQDHGSQSGDRDGGASEDEEGEKEDEEEEEEEEEEFEGSGKRMMAEVHWCFRRQDLPGVMKNLNVQDNEVFLAASPIRPVSTILPITLLQKTVPIYSREFFNDQFQPTKSVVKGWTYIRQGVYWCDKAFDKGAKGGKVYSVDLDEWRESGKVGGGWKVELKELEPEPEPEPEVDEEDDVDSEEEAEIAEGEDEVEDEVEDEDVEMGAGTPRKRKTVSVKSKTSKPTTPRKKQKTSTATAQTKSASRAKTVTKGSKKKVPHPKSSTSNLPATILPENLPKNPYERALRLLHVGATPDSLPCREEEFVDVLSRVEEGVEGGGGGCLYIAGVPGTGKTATVHAVVKELKRKAEDGELAPFSYVEINGLKIPSPQHAYTVLWEAISGVKGCSSKTALRGLEGHFGRKTAGVRGPRGHTFVVLMDELDQLLTAKQDVVYNFFNWPAMRDSQLFVIAVANRMDLPQHLAAKIKSRLGLQTILFQPYDRQNLIEIVQSRLIPHPSAPAEDHKVLLPDAIALAATRMAGTNGDARRVLDACRRAVEVSLDSAVPSPVNPKQMMAVLNLMSSSPVAMFVKHCSVQQKIMLASVVRCVRREGVSEIPWRNIRTDLDALTRSLLDTNDLLSASELALLLSSLISTHAVTQAYDTKVSVDDRKVALGMEISEVGRVLMNEGDEWRKALAGT